MTDNELNYLNYLVVSKQMVSNFIFSLEGGRFSSDQRELSFGLVLSVGQRRVLLVVWFRRGC